MATSAPLVSPSPSKVFLVDDVCEEILVRLPADQPKLLYRMTAVCRSWRRLLTDPAFLRRYREFHSLRQMIGYIHDGGGGGEVVASFVSTATNTFSPRVPGNGVDLYALDSRHGRVLFGKLGKGWSGESSLVVWDPVTDHHEHVPLPKPFRFDDFNFTAAILCDVPGCDHLDCHGGPFRVVFVGIKRYKGAYSTSAFKYTSASGAWTVSPAAAAALVDEEDFGFLQATHTTLVGTSLYFRSPGRILGYWFGAEVEHLVYIDIPPFITEEARGTILMPAADGRLGFAVMYRGGGAGDTRIDFWETGVRADGAVDWFRTKNALVNVPVPAVRLIGVAASSLFIRTSDDGIISIDMGSGRFQKVPQARAPDILGLVPFMRFSIPPGDA